MDDKKPHKIAHADWKAKAIGLFGPDVGDWAFVCPCCGHVAKVRDWEMAGAKPGQIAFSCIGRLIGAKREAFGKGDGPCDYAGGGLFQLNPVEVVYPTGRVHSVFEFAESGEDNAE